MNSVQTANYLTLPDIKRRDESDAHWQAAFAWYNDYVAQFKMEPVAMDCGLCWFQVYMMLKSMKGFRAVETSIRIVNSNL